MFVFDWQLSAIDDLLMLPKIDSFKVFALPVPSTTSDTWVAAVVFTFAMAF